MISAFGVDHGYEISKVGSRDAMLVHSGAMKAGLAGLKHGLKRGDRSLEGYPKHNSKKRTGKLQRIGDSRIDHPNRIRGYVDLRRRSYSTYVPPKPGDIR